MGLKISIHKKARTVVGIEQQSHMWPYLAISALLFASSAIWFSSLYPAFSGNILASGACSPWRVLCACAHFSSLSSLPKSFLLVNAIYRKMMSVNHTLMIPNTPIHTWRQCILLVDYPLLNDQIPCFPTQSISDEELDDIEREVEDDVVKPHNTSPAPPNAFD